MKRYALLVTLLLAVVMCSASTTMVGPRGGIMTQQSMAYTNGGGTLASSADSTSAAHEANIELRFGTVSGTYTTCTIQATTSYDGTNYLTLGSAAAITVTTGTANAWSIIGQLGTTSVTTTAVSTTAALAFGKLTKYTLACSGAYGTTAPATLSVVYR